MASRFSGIGAILVATVFFLMGNGLIGTLAPLRANLEGFSDIAVGVLGACYFAGFVIGCLMGPPLLARVGHIRVFALAASLAGVSVLLLPILNTPYAWYGLRALTGLCIAMLFTALESWLNDRATNENRGRLLSTYVVVNLVALIMGQWLLMLGDVAAYQLFSIGAVLYCLCLVPIALTTLPQPAPMERRPRIRIFHLFRVSPVGAAGCITVGLANGAFWTLAPVYAQSLDFSTRELALFMSVFIAGGALVQWPLGRLSDGTDRRWVIAAICTAASFCGLILGIFGWLLVKAPDLFFAVVFLLGAAMLPLYSLSIAHANDRLPRSEFVASSAGLLMINAAMSVPGPILAAIVTSAAGPHALFLFTALAHAAMAFFAFTRTRVREAPLPEMRDPFAAVPHGSPAALTLDPRAEDKPTSEEPPPPASVDPAEPR